MSLIKIYIFFPTTSRSIQLTLTQKVLVHQIIFSCWVRSQWNINRGDADLISALKQSSCPVFAVISVGPGAVRGASFSAAAHSQRTRRGKAVSQQERRGGADGREGEGQKDVV